MKFRFLMVSVPSWGVPVGKPDHIIAAVQDGRRNCGAWVGVILKYW